MDQAELQRCRVVAITAPSNSPTQPGAGSGGTEPHIIMSPLYPAQGKTRGFMLFIEGVGVLPVIGGGFNLVVWKRDSTTRRWANLLSASLPPDTWLTACDCPPTELYFSVTNVDGVGLVNIHFEEI